MLHSPKPKGNAMPALHDAPTTQRYICLEDVQTHNLKGFSLNIPKHQLVVFTGISGSGKSSLVFDTLYSEAQRRYMNTLSDYAQQFMGKQEKAPVRKLTGLSPAIAIEQKTTLYSPRSTVGTVTNIMDYLRVLFAKAGRAYCPQCGANVQPQRLPQMLERIKKLPEATRIQILSPLIRGRKGDYGALFEQLRKEGFARAYVDGKMLDLDELPDNFKLERYKVHHIDAVVDRIVMRHNKDATLHRLEQALSKAVQRSNGYMRLLSQEPHQDTEKETLMSTFMACHACDLDFGEMAPRLFSFNSPYGACVTCKGTGHQLHIDEKTLIKDGSLSLKDGAMPALAYLLWGKHKRVLSAFEKFLHLPVSKPWKSWKKEEKHLFFYGREKESHKLAPVTEIDYEDSPEDWESFFENFEGILPLLRLKANTGGLTSQAYFRQFTLQDDCPDCDGHRLKPFSLNVRLGDTLTWKDLSAMSLSDAYDALVNLSHELTPTEALIAQVPMKEVLARLQFLKNVGVTYLTLGRQASTLSGGEAQRIRLASQLGSGLSGVMYVLDEPSIGLHAHNNQQLINTLKELRDKGNTVLVVEHDEELIRQADYAVDIGPNAGIHGGELVFAGLPSELEEQVDSITGDYLAGRRRIAMNHTKKLPKVEKTLQLKGCTHHNLQNLNITLPLGKMVTVTGMSGSGKSTLLFDCLLPYVEQYIQAVTGAYGRKKDIPLKDLKLTMPKGVKAIEGIEQIDKLVVVDQSPIGRTSRSNPATYTGIFDAIRNLYANTLEAKAQGLTASHFSFNVKGGRCEDCKGAGKTTLSVGMLPDAEMLCQTCDGKRFKPEILRVRYKGKNIYELLETSIEDGITIFESHPTLGQHLQLLCDVGLGYLALGQGAPLLSGGEAQRLKLATDLMRKPSGHTLYIFDEPSIGLHWHDLHLFIDVVKRLVDKGHTVLTIEHQLDYIAASDWVIDLGPEGGDNGGRLLAQGTPMQVASVGESLTGHYLHEHLQRTV
jgi:excinuclease ABC subunit A